MTEAIPKMATYADAVAYTRALYGELYFTEFYRDAKNNLCARAGDAKMFREELLPPSTEHAERNWAASVAAALGISKSRRNYLGRWIAEQSDDYLRTAREVVGTIQTEIAEAVRQGHHRHQEDEILGRMSEHLAKLGVDDYKIDEQRERERFKHFERGSCRHHRKRDARE